MITDQPNPGCNKCKHYIWKIETSKVTLFHRCDHEENQTYDYDPLVGFLPGDCCICNENGRCDYFKKKI